MKQRSDAGGTPCRRRVALTVAVLVWFMHPGSSPALQALDGPHAAAVTGEFVSAALRLSAGWLNGTAHETVYDLADGGRRKISELTWDMKNLAMLGGEASVRFFDRLSINAGCWGALNKGNGQMDDYDWQLEGDNRPWTDWSLSDVDVTRALLFDVNAAVELLRFEPAALRVALGYKENRWAWEDRGVRYVYSSDPSTPKGFRDQAGELHGKNTINYEQTLRIPYLGVGGTLSVLRRLDLDLYFNYSPLVQAKDRDEHVLREIWFEETFRNGNYFGAGARAAYTFPCRVSLSARFDYQVIPEIIGDTEIWGAEGRSSTKDDAGLDNECWMASIEAGYSF